MSKNYSKIAVAVAILAMPWASTQMHAQDNVGSVDALGLQAVEAVGTIVPDTVGISTQPQPQAATPQEVIEVFDRGLEPISFVPKGQWIAGVSVSYTQSDQKNYQFLIVENITGETYQFKVGPMLFYTFADNMAAGAKFTYTRQRTQIDNANVKIDSETSYDVDNLFSISHTYSTMAAFRYYMSFGNSTRFGMFSEVQFQMSGGQSKLCNGTGKDLTGTYERNLGLNVGLAPGIVMFLSNYSAIEVNVGLLGFNYKHTKSITDQVYVANRHVNSANFRVNLFSITFGVAFYI